MFMPSIRLRVTLGCEVSARQMLAKNMNCSAPNRVRGAAAVLLRTVTGAMAIGSRRLG